MKSLKLPSSLRSYTEGEKVVQVEGNTVREALQNLVDRFPGLQEHIFSRKGELRPFINIFLNGEDVRGMQGEETALQEGDRLMIVPSIAGGGEARLWLRN